MSIHPCFFPCRHWNQAILTCMWTIELMVKKKNKSIRKLSLSLIAGWCQMSFFFFDNICQMSCFQLSNPTRKSNFAGDREEDWISIVVGKKTVLKLGRRYVSSWAPASSSCPCPLPLSWQPHWSTGAAITISFCRIHDTVLVQQTSLSPCINHMEKCHPSGMQDATIYGQRRRQNERLPEGAYMTKNWSCFFVFGWVRSFMSIEDTHKTSVSHFSNFDPMAKWSKQKDWYCLVARK